MAGYIGAKQGVTQVDGYNRSEADAEFVNDPNDVITVSGSNVGIGLSTNIDRKLHVEVDNNYAAKFGGTGGGSDTAIEIGQTGTNQAAGFNATAGSMKFSIEGTEACRIDSSGNLLVGQSSTTTPVSGNVVGTALQAGGRLELTCDGNTPIRLNRKTSDGDIAQFRKDGSIVGSIVSGSGGIRSMLNGYTITHNGGTGMGFGYGTISGNPIFFPVDSSYSGMDNIVDLGSSSARFDDVYATNGTIQTSDRNEKQDIVELDEAEKRAAIAAKGLIRKYRWKDAVAKKGDEARIHFGIIAQDLQAAFEAEGLDAGRYGMFISSTWWEAEVEKTREVEQEDGTTVTETYTETETYDEPTEGATERTRLGVRYPELLAFIIAAL